MRPDRSDTGFFREEAVRHHVRDGDSEGVLQASPAWSWTVLLISALIVALALVLLVVTEVEITGRTDGVVQASTDRRPGGAASKSLRVVAPLADRHSPYVSVGDRVRIELRDPPPGVRAFLAGRILRIDSGPFVPGTDPSDAPLPSTALFMEIAFDPAAGETLHGARLRPGMPVGVRMTLRRQRLIAYIAGPLQGWLK